MAGLSRGATNVHTNSLPEDLRDWLSQANRRVAGLRLNQIADAKAFSASTIPHDAFLQLRAICQPAGVAQEAAQGLLEAGLITNDDYETAEVLLARRPRKKNHLSHFLKEISDIGEPHTPLAQSADDDDAVERLGCFVPSLSQYRQLKPAAEAAMTASPPQPPVDDQLFAWGTPPKLDLKQGGTGDPLLDDLADCFGDFGISFDDLDILGQSTPSRKPRDHQYPVHEQPGTRASSTPSPEHSLAQPTSQEPSAPSSRFATGGRTAYEVQTSHFFGTFFHALFSWAICISWTSYINVVPEERRYQFGRKPEASNGEPKPLFNATADGGFYGSSTPRPPIFHFELKRSLREDKLLAIYRQEVAEMVAILYSELHRNADGNIQLDRVDAVDKKHRLMVSFGRNEFHIILANYTKSYLAYIADGNNTTNPKDRTILEDDMIYFKSFGPFALHDNTYMDEFCRIMVSLAVHQFQDEKGRATIERIKSRARQT